MSVKRLKKSLIRSIDSFKDEICSTVKGDTPIVQSVLEEKIGDHIDDMQRLLVRLREARS